MEELEDVLDFEVAPVFPCPVYITGRDSDLNSTEEKEIEDIINKEGMYKNTYNEVSQNSYIFDTRLHNLKEFCEEHIKIYVKKIIDPKKALKIFATIYYYGL